MTVRHCSNTSNVFEVGRKPKPKDEKRITVTLRMLPRLAEKLDAIAEAKSGSRGSIVEGWTERARKSKCKTANAGNSSEELETKTPETKDE